MDTMELPIEFRFHPRERYLPSVLDHDAVPGELPVYLASGTFALRGRSYEAVSYQLFYTQNPSYSCLFPRDPALGYHEYDVERLTVLFQDRRPVWVYYGAHSRGQGQWVAWGDAPKTEDGALVAYVALNSHALYPEPATYWRVFGLANDRCSRRGKHLRVTRYLPAFPFREPNGIQMLGVVPNLGQASVTPGSGSSSPSTPTTSPIGRLEV